VAETPLKREVIEQLAREQPQALVEIVLQQSAAIAEQGELIEKQRQAIGALEERVRQLEEALSQGGGPPGAAPFRLAPHKRKGTPKAPGREAGHRGEFRSAPELLDEVIEVALKQCPKCGRAIAKTIALKQTIVELPAVRPVVIGLITHRGRCEHCGQRVQSAHPLQVSRACGAAGTQLGPRALATAALLRHGMGLTVRSCCGVLEKLFSLPLSAGGLCHALDRLATRMEGSYQQLSKQLEQSAVVHTDETSWWLQNERSTLWVFATPERTVYRVVEHRDRATLHQTIGPYYAGVLVSDCLSLYDDATSVQHKCYAHHLKAIAAAQAARASPSGWLASVEALLKNAIALSKERSVLERAQWEQAVRGLDLAAHAVLEENPRACVQEEAVRARLWKQRDHLFVFLERAGVDATNNLAERQLRPAVIRRKLSCGNKTRRGARTFEVLASLAATCRQRGEDFLQSAANAARLQPA
jgi:transposase